MAEPFLSEIRIFSFNFPPKGWAFCNGSLLPINQNQALFSLLGTTYGGDGQVTFALPNLQGRVPIHQGDGHTQGEVGGSTAVTITQSADAARTSIRARHQPTAGTPAAADATIFLAQAASNVYTRLRQPATAINPGSRSPTSAARRRTTTWSRIWS